jgi:hypothetical protein
VSIYLCSKWIYKSVQHPIFFLDSKHVPLCSVIYVIWNDWSLESSLKQTTTLGSPHRGGVGAHYTGTVGNAPNPNEQLWRFPYFAAVYHQYLSSCCRQKEPLPCTFVVSDRGWDCFHPFSTGFGIHQHSGDNICVLQNQSFALRSVSLVCFSCLKTNLPYIFCRPYRRRNDQFLAEPWRCKNLNRASRVQVTAKMIAL